MRLSAILAIWHALGGQAPDLILYCTQKAFTFDSHYHIATYKCPVCALFILYMLVGVVTYIRWRWWEGITQQGANPEYSKAKNFFSFRLSPLVSG